jgi:sulfate adenylyltransferase subunit 1 (EFTu-like GTPase family)
VGQDVEAMVCWLNDRPLAPGAKYAVKHTTRWCRAVVRELRYRLDVNTLHRDDSASSLTLNEIGRVSLRMTAPLFYDGYRRNRTTGSFILVEEATNSTVGGGMIIGPGD